MRKKPPETPPDLAGKSDPEMIVMKRKYKLLTPLYGGGVKAGKVDLETPIHGTGIRGQLRFWWRATRGWRFNGDMVAMKAEEDRIWGSTGGGSLVSIAAKSTSKASEFVAKSNGQPIDVGHPRSPYGYVAFPLRNDNNNPAGKVYDQVTFTLQVAFSTTLAEEVQAALWAWDTFGGVGARTRRGFGALRCLDVQPGEGSATFDKDVWRWEYDCNTAGTQLQKDVKHFVHEGRFPGGVPHLSRQGGRYKLTKPHNDAMKVWKHLIDELRDFRQNRNGRFGRSHWPEPDAIRAATGQSLKSRGHDEPWPYDPIIDKFPRAAFGLPIIFAFKREDSHPTDIDRDPRETTLTAAAGGIDRLASPLIFRPLACKGGRYVGLALILNAPVVPPGGLALKGSGINRNADPKLSGADIGRINSKHSWGNITVDILQSFLDGLNQEVS